MTKKILITGAGGPAGVNLTQSLRIAPERLLLVGTEANRYYSYLASTDKIYVVPEATDPDYVDRLNEIIEKEKVEFVHPQTDIEVRTISSARKKIEANTFLPSRDAVHICQDKLKSAERWKKEGIPVARTIELKDEADVKDAFRKLGTPIWIRATSGAGGRGSTPATSVETALSWISYWKSRNKRWGFIAQEHLEGRNIGFHSLWKDGELVASMARERLLYIYPHLAPSGVTGTPSVQRTIHDDKTNEIATDAVLAIDPNFNGIACVDLKENDEGVPCATEINAGRMFTTSFFFSCASRKFLKNHYANLPYLYVKLGYNERISNIPKYNILPEGLYWIRHIDAPARLLKAGRVVEAMYT